MYTHILIPTDGSGAPKLSLWVLILVTLVTRFWNFPLRDRYREKWLCSDLM